MNVEAVVTDAQVERIVGEVLPRAQEAASELRQGLEQLSQALSVSGESRLKLAAAQALEVLPQEARHVQRYLEIARSYLGQGEIQQCDQLLAGLIQALKNQHSLRAPGQDGSEL